MYKSYRHLFERYDPWGGITLVYWYCPDNPFKLMYQFAICSKKDHYSRKIGVEVATSGIEYTIYTMYEDQDVLKIILEDILTKGSLPRSPLLEVRNWLISLLFKRYVLEEKRIDNLFAARIGEDNE